MELYFEKLKMIKTRKGYINIFIIIIDWRWYFGRPKSLSLKCSSHHWKVCLLHRRLWYVTCITHGSPNVKKCWMWVVLININIKIKCLVVRYCYNERFLSVGIQEEGIYRLSGVKSKVQALLDRFMAGEYSTWFLKHWAGTVSNYLASHCKC